MPSTDTRAHLVFHLSTSTTWPCLSVHTLPDFAFAFLYTGRVLSVTVPFWAVSDADVVVAAALASAVCQLSSALVSAESFM